MSLYSKSLIILMVWMVHSSTLAASESRIHPKPSSPVSVIIEPQNYVQVADPVEFVVTASSMIDADSFVVTVQPPPGTQVQQGNLTWNGTIKKGETISLTFTILFPKNTGSYLNATASINSSGQGRFGARAVWNLPENKFASKSKQTELQKRRSIRNGRGIVEFNLK